jgi:hypothetical protein
MGSLLFNTTSEQFTSDQIKYIRDTWSIDIIVGIPKEMENVWNNIPSTATSTEITALCQAILNYVNFNINLNKNLVSDKNFILIHDNHIATNTLSQICKNEGNNLTLIYIRDNMFNIVE